MKTHSAMYIKNPFAGMDLSETPAKDSDGRPVWTKGVSISYWVKAPVYDLSQEQQDNGVLKNDSILLTFQNDGPDGNGTLQYQDDDLIKYEACEAANAILKDGKESYVGEYSGDTYTAADFSLGTAYDLTDQKNDRDPSNDQVYHCFKDYGKLIRFNPDYPATPSEKYYFEDPDSSTKFRGPDGKMTGVTEIGQNLNTTAYNTLDVDKGSMVKRSHVHGSLTIAASNSFAFKEDHYAMKQVADEATGKPKNVVIQGSKEENPNTAEYKNGEYQEGKHYNMLAFQGDGYVLDETGTKTDENGQEVPDTEWHYVTCVIMNDWVDFYVDGEKIDGEREWKYSPTAGIGFDSRIAGKRFNYGYGLRGATWGLKGADDWNKNGTANPSPANKMDQPMLNWISNENTKLMIGGEGTANLGLDGQKIGTADGALLDDISFYGEPLTADQAAALYDSVKDSKTAKPAATELQKFSFDSDANHGAPAGMSPASTNGSTQAPEVVNDGVRGHVLKVYEGTATATSGTEFANPFAGKDLTGATVSYWYRGKPDDRRNQIQNSINISFRDEPKKLVHSKIQDANKDKETRTGLWVMSSMEANFEAGYDTPVYTSLKNSFYTSTRYMVFEQKSQPGYREAAGQALQEYADRLQSFSQWHFVTVVMNNAGITMYYDGKQLPNNRIDNQGLPSFYGPRFFDGYYARVNDGFAKFKLASDNQGATPLMTFLTQADTTAYIGVSNVPGSDRTYQTASQGYYDNITYYDTDMTAEQVQQLYQTEAANVSGPVAGEDIEAGSEAQNPNSVVAKNPFTAGADGSLTASANGVTVTVPAGAIPDGCELVVTTLGTADMASAYANADAVLAGIANLQVAQRLLYDIHIEKDGETIQPTADVTVTITPPSGYTASRCTVVSINGKTVMGGLTFQTRELGVFALVEVKEGTSLPPAGSISGNANNSNNSKSGSNSGSSNAGKTGDMMNVVLPILLLAAAFAAVVVTRRRRSAQ